jgi:hypothetical protein
MRLHTKILSAALLSAALAAAGFAQSKNPHVDLKETKLANGLRVITVEDHKAPVIAVSVTYNVGSRNQKPRRTWQRLQSVSCARITDQGLCHFVRHFPKGNEPTT